MTTIQNLTDGCKPTPASERLLLLAERMDQARFADQDLGGDVRAELGLQSDNWFMESVDGALAMLPQKMEWRRLTNQGCSVYSSSPRAKAQVRYDGFSDHPARAIVAAFLRYKAQLAKNAEARAAA